MKFAAGYANRLILEPGQMVSGFVDGGNTLGSAQESTLELASGSSTGVLAGVYFNFEQIVVDPGASWDIIGTQHPDCGLVTLDQQRHAVRWRRTDQRGVPGRQRHLPGAGHGSTFWCDKGTIGSGQTIAFSSHSGQIDVNAADFSGIIGHPETGDTILVDRYRQRRLMHDILFNGDTLDLVESNHSHIDLTFNQDYSAGRVLRSRPKIAEATR